MQSDNIEIAKRMLDAWNAGNVDRMIDFWTEDGDWIWEDAPDLPDARVVRGREQVEAHLRDVMGLLGDLKLEAEEFVDLGDDLLVVVRTSVHGAQSGIELDTPGFHLVRFENGRVRRYRWFLDRDQAVRAAG